MPTQSRDGVIAQFIHIILYLFLVVPKAIQRSLYGVGEGPILLDNLHCNGDEESLKDCSHDGVGVFSCSHYEIASVVCLNGECCTDIVTFEHVFIINCLWLLILPMSTESECDSGQVRLVGGRIMSEGQVEVCANGTWGRVCRDLWDDDDARVVCRQLGYSDQSEFIEN